MAVIIGIVIFIFVHYYVNNKTKEKKKNTTGSTGSIDDTKDLNNVSKIASNIKALSLLDVLQVVHYYLFYSSRMPKDEHVDVLLIHLISDILSKFRLFYLILTLLILLLFLPTYVGLKYSNKDYSSQTHQYGWLLSIAYLEGSLPGTVIGLIWLFYFSHYWV